MEYEHPWLFADALAFIAVHQPELDIFLCRAEQEAKASDARSTLVELQDAIRGSAKLRSAMHYELAQKIYDGLIAEAGDELYRIISQWKVRPEEVELKCAELVNAAGVFSCPMYRPFSITAH